MSDTDVVTPETADESTSEFLVIKMTMQEANALNAAIGQVDRRRIDEEDREPLRWVMNRIGKAWVAEAERRAAKNDGACNECGKPKREA